MVPRSILCAMNIYTNTYIIRIVEVSEMEIVQLTPLHEVKFHELKEDKEEI